MFETSLVLSSFQRWAVIRDARRRQRRRRQRSALAIVAALVIAVPVLLLTGRSSTGSSQASSASAVGSVKLDGFVLDTASSARRVWVLTCVRDCAREDVGKDEEQLVEVDATTRAVVGRFSLSNAVAIAAGGGSVWVAHFLTGEVTRLDPRTGRTTAAITLQLPTPIVTHVRDLVRHDRRFLPSGMTYADGYVWVSTARGWVAQISSHTGKLVSMIASPSEATSTTTDSHGTWVAENLGGVGFLAPRRHRLTIRPISWQGQTVDVNMLTQSGRRIWAVGQIVARLTGPVLTVVTMIDSSTGRIVYEHQVSGTEGAVSTANGLYLGDLQHGRVYRLTRGGQVQTITTAPHQATFATATPGTLWATTTGQAGRLITIRLPGSAPSSS
jgi:hypothetical protein